jgi:hypothetical protein
VLVEIKGIVRAFDILFEIEYISWIFLECLRDIICAWLVVSRTKLFSDCWLDSPNCFAAGRDRTFSYGSVYPKETATKTWDHAVPSYPLAQAWLVQTNVFLHSLYSMVNTGTATWKSPHFALKLAQVLCEEALRI